MKASAFENSSCLLSSPFDSHVNSSSSTVPSTWALPMKKRFGLDEQRFSFCTLVATLETVTAAGCSAVGLAA
ncbi:hypothetical protein MUK42_25301 [Musa troglodytarum]|uniref:Uncharacterized protein n=1 Tax=Musa troglodytarum TaxID=320322 RepID=A0A9E7JDI1_9LILI|nr:hypothetical protein MUK42_25301 [Musa troglodytarum]